MNTNTLVHFDAVSFSMTTTNDKNVVVTTLINLLEDDVPIERVMGALCAGASRRTRWQNDKKATKKQPAKEIPTQVDIKWGDWIGAEGVQRSQMPSDEEMLAVLRKKYPHMFAS